MVRFRSRGLHGLDAARTAAGRIRGGISPVGITGFDTAQEMGIESLCDRFHLLSEDVRVPSSFSHAVSGTRKSRRSLRYLFRLLVPYTFQKFRLPVLSKIFLQNCSTSCIGYQSLKM
ncbi:unnamed protein product [Strongylus vulgaris]|uniref:Uncharacterized protein n=1 Tax=Strongylus vulgaris TaxID=40348 RepID=A0A3P7JUH3_STRVU|nr:unnamed protein product [Strongylus vulgaris]